MKSTLRFVRTAASILTLAAALSGCSSDDAQETSATANSGTAPVAANASGAANNGAAKDEQAVPATGDAQAVPKILE